MRALVAVIAAAFAAIPAAAADPIAAPGYELESVQVPGAIFAGIAGDGDGLLVTDLAKGQVLRRGSDGGFVALGPTLPHGIDVIGDPTGPYRIVRAGDGYLVAQGWTAAGAEPSPYDHAILSIDATGGVRIVSADFWNPFDFVASDDWIFVVDSARNTIERLGPSGARQTIFSFTRLTQAAASMKSLSPTEFSGEQPYQADAVPTGILLRGGRLYVALFGGFPFAAGSGQVVSLGESGELDSLRVELKGLNAPVDVSVDSTGSLLVLEHGTYDQAAGFLPGTGRLLRFDAATGERLAVIDGLTRPAAVLVADGEIVVSELGGSLLFVRTPPRWPRSGR